MRSRNSLTRGNEVAEERSGDSRLTDDLHSILCVVDVLAMSLLAMILAVENKQTSTSVSMIRAERPYVIDKTMREAQLA